MPSQPLQTYYEEFILDVNVQNSPQSEHTSGRGTNESNSDSSCGGLGRATPPLKPLGLPKQ